MMKIKRYFQYTKYSFIAFIALIGLLIVSGFVGIHTLNQRQEWADHTNQIMSQIEIAERSFSSADFAGRNQMVTGVLNNRLPEMRKKALDDLRTVKAAIRENPVQVDNIDSLESAIAASFKTQDEQLESAVKTEKEIIYKLDATAKRIQYIESVETLFTRIKVNEMNLLRIDRMPRLALWQWRIVYFTGGVIVLLLINTIILFVFHMKVLKRNIEAIEFMENVNLDKSGEFISSEDAEKMKQFLAHELAALEAAQVQ